MRSIMTGIIGGELEGMDGIVGKVSDAYFDDRGWTIRYLVVKTGNWLTGRSVLISPNSLGKLERSRKTLPVKLTQKQIKDSPPLDSERPVSAQYEREFSDYYGYPYYWQGPSTMGGLGISVVPGIYPAHETRLHPPYSTDKKESDSENSHLRSANQVHGYQVQAVDGELGHVEDFLLDEDSWKIHFVGLETGTWMLGKKVVVPSGLLKNISWAERNVSIHLSRDEIRNAPGYEENSISAKGYGEAVDRFYAEKNSGMVENY